jgi:para-aminobenzoate synthetase component I
LKQSDFITQMNERGSQKQAFFFMINFDCSEFEIIPISDLHKHNILIDIPKFNNISPKQISNKALKFEASPVSFAEYKKAFDLIQKGIKHGDSFLANLCFKTPVNCNLSLLEIFYRSNALMKLYYKNKFVCFSPERFIRINNGIISSYPMKGTIDASIADAYEKILKNSKESAEHNTIVDLIRNDLGRVCESVELTRYRYIDKIKTNKGEILQVSSEIQGKLPKDYKNRLGEIICSMLPAGSISGAPKKRTVEMIKEAETFDRGFFTGIFGVFNGNSMDTAVIIRFLENTDQGLFYKSGGGITVNSIAKEEYQEMIQKIYVPII